MTTFNIAKIFESIPSQGLDFEYCPVQQTQEKCFTICNSGKTMVTYDVKTD